MSAPTLQDQIAAAGGYEDLLVPALFAQWAPRVADAARIATGDRVLDVACGTGVLARAAAPRVVALLERVAGRRAADALRAPFVLGDGNELVALFASAGITATVTTRAGTARFPSVRSMVEADLRGWLPVMGVVLSEHEIERILEEAEDVLRSYVTPDGTVVFDSPAHIATATKPGGRDGS